MERPPPESESESSEEEEEEEEDDEPLKYEEHVMETDVIEKIVGSERGLFEVEWK